MTRLIRCRRGQPFYESCIDSNTQEELKAKGIWESLEKMEKVTYAPNATDGSNTRSRGEADTPLCGLLVSSPSNIIDKHSGRANIWRCPGGEAACPQSKQGACAHGHKGVACAVCSPGFAQDASRECIKCPGATGAYLALFVTLSATALFALVYFYSAAPIRASHSGEGAVRRLLLRFFQMSLVLRVRAWLQRLLENAATRYLAMTTNDDPYAARAGAKPGSILETAKILISEKLFMLHYLSLNLSCKDIGTLGKY